MKLRIAVIAGMMTLNLGAQVAPAGAAELKPLYRESFDTGKIDGPVGKAGASLSVPAPGKIDLDRGTLAFFMKLPNGPQATEWGVMAGADSMRGDGYWGMLLCFAARREEFLFNLHDIGRYAPPLRAGPFFDAWKAGEWHHLAAVWDRQQGVTVYQDGKRVSSNWGKHHWEWNSLPVNLFVNNPVDEFQTYGEALTDAQIAQLAKGEMPSGEPMAALPAAAARPLELARYGWEGASLAALPVVEAGKGQMFTFAPIVRAVDAKRPVGGPYDGFTRTPWPNLVYGASVRGKYLDMFLQPGAKYDRVRTFTQGQFEGRLVRLPDDTRNAPPTAYSVASVKSGVPEALPRELAEREKTPLVDIVTPRAALWQRKLPQALTDTHIALECAEGSLGEIDFYRTENMPAVPARELTSYSFEAAATLPYSTTGDALATETPLRLQRPVLATTAKVAAWQLATPAFGGFQGVTTPPGDAKAWDGVVVTLVAENLTQPTPVRVQIKEPIHGLRDWLIGDAVLQPKGTGRQIFTLYLKGRSIVNMPSYARPKYLGNGKYAEKPDVYPSVPFGIKVEAGNAVTWQMGDGGCSVAFHQTDMKKALPQAVADQVEYMREAYSDVMEGHAYSHHRLVTPMLWLTKFAPDNAEFRQMYNRADRPLWFPDIYKTVPEFTYTLPVNNTGAPDWAFWQMLDVKEHRRLLNWYIDSAQLSNGEYGGVWNDDTDHIENWIDHALCMDDDDKIKNSLRFFLDKLYTTQLEEGVGKYVQDDLHYYEEGSGALGMQTLVDYGEPVAVERAMAASSHFDKWMVEKNGKWVQKSIWVGSHGPWMERDFNIIDKERFGGYPLIPAGYLVWYNRHPGAAKYFKGWEEKLGFGGFYDAVAWRAAGREAEARKQWEEQLRKPARDADAAAYNALIDDIGVSDEVRKAQAKEFKAPGPIMHYWGAKDTDTHWLRYKVSGDVRWLTESYKRTWEWFQSHDWLNTAAMPSMDRNPLPRWALMRSRMGALAANRGALVRYPLHAISYTKGANDVAALVEENLDTKIKARFYAFTDKPHALQLRVWRLTPGNYQVTLANDKNDDGVAEETISDRKLALERGAYLDLTLPQRQSVLLTVTAIDTHPFNYDRPDPAISARTAGFIYHDHLVVYVHNLGTKPVENLVVRARDGRSGELIVNGEQVIDRIEAPLDMKPRWKAVEFKNVDANSFGSIVIEIDPDKKIDDLNPYNNRVVVEYRGTQRATSHDAE